LVRYVITLIKFVTAVGDKVFSDHDVLLCNLWRATNRKAFN